MSIQLQEDYQFAPIVGDAPEGCRSYLLDGEIHCAPEDYARLNEMQFNGSLVVA